jgi:hypothetical protein
MNLIKIALSFVFFSLALSVSAQTIETTMAVQKTETKTCDPTKTGIKYENLISQQVNTCSGTNSNMPYSYNLLPPALQMTLSDGSIITCQSVVGPCAEGFKRALEEDAIVVKRLRKEFLSAKKYGPPVIYGPPAVTFEYVK